MTPPMLDTLIETLGTDGAQRFLAFALPQIRQTRHELLNCLREQDWEAAAAIVHRFRATAHLYSTTALQECLATILARETTSLLQPSFLSGLEEEFQRIENSINIHLGKKYTK